MNFFQKLFSRQKNDEFDLFDPDTHEGLMNEELQAAIEAVTAENTSEHRRVLYEILLETTFCLPAFGSDEDTSQISATQNENGEMVLAAFSDPAALRRWEAKPESMMVMPAAQLFEMAIENDFAEILINPAGPAGGKLSKQEFTQLAQGEFPE